MSQADAAFAGLARANPVPNGSDAVADAWTEAALLDVIDERSATMKIDELTDSPFEPKAERPKRRLGFAVAGAAFVAILLVVGVAAIVGSGDDGTVGEPAATTPDQPTAGLTGDFFGSASSSPFVEIQKGLATQIPTPGFSAEISGELDPSQVYFRLLTLESFTGGRWFARSPRVFPLEDRPWEIEDQAFVGPTARVTADVTILALTMDWLPAPYAPVAAGSPDRSVEDALRVRPADASLRYDGGRSYFDMQYSVTADVPQLDQAVLASTADGTLSPLFATAADAGNDVPAPVPDLEERELVDRETHVELPEDIDGRIEQQARELTAMLTTPFEKGLALEKWFRQSGGFSYDVTADTGHGTETLAAWLFDTDDPGYRRGYSEQFATSLAVMARTLDIPSRVVLGFTPGEPIGENEVVVSDRNAHAWVELWIPTQGWIRFDPTPRPAGETTPTFEIIGEQLGFDLTPYLLP